jgi:hypothetical protein
MGNRPSAGGSSTIVFLQARPKVCVRSADLAVFVNASLAYWLSMPFVGGAPADDLSFLHLPSPPLLPAFLANRAQKDDMWFHCRTPADPM